MLKISLKTRNSRLGIMDHLQSRTVCTLWLALALGLFSRTPANAQSKPSTPSSKADQTSELTEDLLDLLDQPSSTDANPKPVLTPADVGLENEDLSEDSSNPLLAVRQSMLIAAGFLERGRIDSETQQLQSDIVQRLDDLINEFEQPPQDNEQSQQPDQESGQTESETQQTQSSRQSTASMETEELPQPEDPSASNIGELPGQAGMAAEAIENLKDPVALQQSVWGQLPERVRQQMQSQMVEQFLPSYKSQIETYFKALLEQP